MSGGVVAVAVDVVTFTLDDEGRLLVVLSPPRRREPYRGEWALPGRRVRDDEDLETAARAVLREFAGLGRPRHLEQLASFGAPERDPRGRVVSVSYLALLPQTAPLDVGATWTRVADVPPLAFDHEEILEVGVARLRARLAYSTIAYGLLPDAFTLSELQAVYEAVLDRPLDKRNFRRRVTTLGLVTEAQGRRHGPHRPAQLYRFPDRGLVLLDEAIVP